MSNIAAVTAATAAPASPGNSLWSHGSFSFKDLLDIANPLQHIPIIGSVYRYLSGDEPSGGAQIVGDTLYGGPIGFGASVVSSTFFNDSQGHDLGERALAAVFGPPGGSDAATSMVAAASVAPANRATASPVQASGITAMPVPSHPVAMNELFRSAPPAAGTATPEQMFFAKNAAFQRQITSARGADGTVLNNRPVPLELSSNLLPARRIAAPTAKPAAAASVSGVSAKSAPAPSPGKPGPVSGAANSTDTNPIAEKMLDALNKYEQLKKEQESQPGNDAGDPAKVDLTL